MLISELFKHLDDEGAMPCLTADGNLDYPETSLETSVQIELNAESLKKYLLLEARLYKGAETLRAMEEKGESVTPKFRKWLNSFVNLLHEYETTRASQ